MDSRQAYLVILALYAGERLVELALTARNRRWARARGGVESGRGHYPWMVGVHALFLPAAAAEVWLFDRTFLTPLAAAMAILLVLAMALRYWAVGSLGPRWTTRLVVVPGTPAVASGPYRFVRHPNYTAVTVEMFALPLLHSAYLTAILFSAASAVLLAVRIPAEEEALRRHSSYDARLGGRPRFLPGRR